MKKHIINCEMFFLVEYPSSTKCTLRWRRGPNWHNCCWPLVATRLPHRPSIFCDGPEMQRRQKSDDDNLEAGDQAVAGDPPGDHADKNKKADEQPCVGSYLACFM